jgi:hypothetical protein
MLSPRAKRTAYASVLAPFLAFAVPFLAFAVLAPSPADAHFMITAAAMPPKPNTVQSWMSEDMVGGPQKNGPCAAVPNTALGDTPGTPTHAVTVVQSGQMVTVPITVTVSHPGWFRIALVEGPSSTQTLTTLPDPVAQTGLPSKSVCTPAIMANPVWSATQPILADGLPAGSTATTEQTGTKTFQVMIPSTASCTTAQPCTLQVIMVMTDHPATDCYYHHCADLALGAGTTDGGNPSGSGGSSATGGAGGAHETGGASGSGNSGGVTGTGGSGTGGTGAVTGTGGSVGTGGSPETAGTTGTGGLPGSGGSSGSGATGNSSGTTTGGTGVGGSGAPATPGSSGCSCVLATRGGPSWALSGAGLLALIIARRRRRR